MSTGPGTATLFSGGVIWTGSADSDALLVVDGIVRALGDQARALASETSSVEKSTSTVAS